MVLNLYDTMTREVRKVFPMDEIWFVFMLVDPPFMDPPILGILELL